MKPTTPKAPTVFAYKDITTLSKWNTKDTTWENAHPLHCSPFQPYNTYSLDLYEDWYRDSSYGLELCAKLFVEGQSIEWISDYLHPCDQEFRTAEPTLVTKVRRAITHNMLSNKFAWELIFQQLPRSDLFACRLVCKAWFVMTHANSLWKAELVDPLLNDLLHAVKPTQYLMEHYTCDNSVCPDDLFHRIGGVKSITENKPPKDCVNPFARPPKGSHSCTALEWADKQPYLCGREPVNFCTDHTHYYLGVVHAIHGPPLINTYYFKQFSLRKKEAKVNREWRKKAIKSIRSSFSDEFIDTVSVEARRRVLEDDEAAMKSHKKRKIAD